MKQIAATLPEPRMQSTKRKIPAAAKPISAPAQDRTGASAAMTSASVAKAAKVAKVAVKASKPARSLGSWLVMCWPIGVALFLSGFAPEWHAMAVSAGIWALRFTFPYALLATHREIGIDAQMATVLPGMAVYLQIPLDGVYMTFSLMRGRTLASSIVQILGIHALCTLVLWLVTYLQ